MSDVHDAVFDSIDRGWTPTKRSTGSVGATDAWWLTHPAHPRLVIEVVVLNIAPHFRARVLVDRRARIDVARLGDLIGMINDPSVIPLD